MKSFLCRLLLASFIVGIVSFCNPRPSINDFLSVTPKKTIDDFLIYGPAWLIIFVGHFFWYFIWCGFQSKKDFVFDIIFFQFSLHNWNTLFVKMHYSGLYRNS